MVKNHRDDISRDVIPVVDFLEVDFLEVDFSKFMPLREFPLSRHLHSPHCPFAPLLITVMSIVEIHLFATLHEKKLKPLPDLPGYHTYPSRSDPQKKNLVN